MEEMGAGGVFGTTKRTAMAGGKVKLSLKTVPQVREGSAPK